MHYYVNRYKAVLSCPNGPVKPPSFSTPNGCIASFEPMQHGMGNKHHHRHLHTRGLWGYLDLAECKVPATVFWGALHHVPESAAHRCTLGCNAMH